MKPNLRKVFQPSSQFCWTVLCIYHPSWCVLVSPICNNHHLIVPNLAKCYNQVWRYDITEEFVTLCENSERDDYVLFFNSLGGFSSVNHLHVRLLSS